VVGCYPHKVINLGIWLREGIKQPEHQEEIMSNNWKYWSMDLDKMIE